MYFIELRFKNDTTIQPPYVGGYQKVARKTRPHTPSAPVQPKPRQQEHQKPGQEEAEP